MGRCILLTCNRRKHSSQPNTKLQNGALPPSASVSSPHFNTSPNYTGTRYTETILHSHGTVLNSGYHGIKQPYPFCYDGELSTTGVILDPDARSDTSSLWGRSAKSIQMR